MGNDEHGSHSRGDDEGEQLSHSGRTSIETASTASSIRDNGPPAGSIRIGPDAAVTLGHDSGATDHATWMRAEDWLGYPVTVQAAGTYDIALGVASPHTETVTLEVSVGETDLGPVAVPRTESWTEYATVTITGQALSAGEQVLRIATVDTGGTESACEIAWVEVTDSDHETITDAVNADDHGTIEGGEILTALDHRRDGAPIPIPNSDGETVTDGVVFDLVEMWNDEVESRAEDR